MIRLMRSLPAVVLFPALVAYASQAQASSGSCPEGLSTVEMSLCIGKLLEQKDLKLSSEMQRVATSASSSTGGQFSLLWKDRLASTFHTSIDPEEQVAAFQQARRNACVYLNSLALQSAGFGITVSHCELRLTDALIQSLQ